ncbi:MAG: hypothetical protein ACRCZI_02655 [Cetobacterium sp.]
MTKFSNWVNKIVIGESSVKKHEEEKKDTQIQTESVDELKKIEEDLDYKIKMLMKIAEKKEYGGKSASDYSELLRKMQTKKVRLQIQSYDLEHKDNKDYRNHLDDDINDDEQSIDDKLGLLLEEKLGLKLDETNVTDEMKAEIERQNKVYEDRVKEHQSRIDAVRNSIKSYDSKRREEDLEYNTFEETCKLNEESAEQNFKPEMNKLGDSAFAMALMKEVDEGDILYNKIEKELEKHNERLVELGKNVHYSQIKNKTKPDEDSESESDNSDSETDDCFNEQQDSKTDAYEAFIKKYSL